MRSLFLGTLLAIAAQPIAAFQSQYVAEGEWEMRYSPSEDLHKLMFASPDSSHAVLYFYCEPQSKKVSFTYEAPATDIRTYRPNVRSKTVASPTEFEVEFDDIISGYRVSQDYDSDSEFLQSLTKGDDLLVEDGQFKLSAPDDGRLFREFTRSCGGSK